MNLLKLLIPPISGHAVLSVISTIFCCCCKKKRQVRIATGKTKPSSSRPCTGSVRQPSALEASGGTGSARHNDAEIDHRKSPLAASAES